jgi:hypothetical protein
MSSNHDVALDRAGITVFPAATFLAAGPASERSRSEAKAMAIAQYIVGALFVLWTLAQVRMLLVYLGKVPSALGIVGSPTLVFRARLSVIVNPIRALLCFVVPWPILLPALTATLAFAPFASALAFFGAFGQRAAHAVYAGAGLGMLTEKGRREYPRMVIRHTFVWVLIVSLLTGGLWYFVAS